MRPLACTIRHPFATALLCTSDAFPIALRLKNNGSPRAHPAVRPAPCTPRATITPILLCLLFKTSTTAVIFRYRMLSRAIP